MVTSSINPPAVIPNISISKLLYIDTRKGSGNNSVGNEMLETALLSDAPNTAVSSEFKVEFCDPDEDSPQELCSEGDPDDTVDIGYI